MVAGDLVGPLGPLARLAGDGPDAGLAGDGREAGLAFEAGLAGDAGEDPDDARA